MNNLDSKFEALLNKLLTNKKEQFSSKYLFKQLKVKDKELINILTLWIDQLIREDKVDLINAGKDKKDDSIFMTKNFFLEKIKHILLTLDFLLDENSTFSFLNNITETQQPNTDLLVDKITKFTRPLVKFDKGSRNVPIMFNLFRIFVPERMINISDQMMEKIETDTDVFPESKQVKKMMFKGGKQQQNYSVSHIIITALSYLLIEKGQLILTKQEIIDSRGYKVFFNSPKFSSFAALVKKMYPFKPYVSEEFISFYPENWLDIDQIKKQMQTEKAELFLKKNFKFLTKDERLSLIKLLTPDQYHVQSEIYTDKKQEIRKEKESSREHESISSKQETEQSMSQKNKKNIEKPLKEKQNQVSTRKKKIQKSEPLTFINEIIHKENENKHSNKSIEKANDQPKENESATGSQLEHVDQFDKTERYYLLRILDSTKINSGYYSHSEKDEKFQRFLDKISTSNLFVITEKDESYFLKRNPTLSNDKYKTLRENLEESIMKTENKENATRINKSEDIELPMSKDIKKESTPPSSVEPGGDLLNDLLLDDQLEPDAKDGQSSTDTTNNNSEQHSLIIENKKDTQETQDLKIDDIDHESFFEIPNKLENQKKEEGTEISHTEVYQEKKEISKGPNKESEQKEPVLDEEIKQDRLDGKIISVLTDDQEKWLKIKKLSEEFGFELRDGLAYKPEIAVFDEGFSHLEPIAKNTGAVILHIDDFMNRLGLGDPH